MQFSHLELFLKQLRPVTFRPTFTRSLAIDCLISTGANYRGIKKRCYCTLVHVFTYLYL